MKPEPVSAANCMKARLMASAPIKASSGSRTPMAEAGGSVSCVAQPLCRLQAGGDVLNSGDFVRRKLLGIACLRAPTLQNNLRVTPELIEEMERYKDWRLAYAHWRVHYARGTRAFSWCSNFACSDSYFHRTMRKSPRTCRFRRICRHGRASSGFHGISYESIVTQLQPDVPERLLWLISAMARPFQPSGTAGALTHRWA